MWSLNFHSDIEAYGSGLFVASPAFHYVNCVRWHCLLKIKKNIIRFKYYTTNVEVKRPINIFSHAVRTLLLYFWLRAVVLLPTSFLDIDDVTTQISAYNNNMNWVWNAFKNTLNSHIYLFRSSLICNIWAQCTHNVSEVHVFTFDSVIHLDFQMGLQTRKILVL